MQLVAGQILARALKLPSSKGASVLGPGSGQRRASSELTINADSELGQASCYWYG